MGSDTSIQIVTNKGLRNGIYNLIKDKAEKGEITFKDDKGAERSHEEWVAALNAVADANDARKANNQTSIFSGGRGRKAVRFRLLRRRSPSRPCIPRAVCHLPPARL